MTSTDEMNISFKGIEANKIFFDPIYKDMARLEGFTVMPSIKSGRQKIMGITAMEDVVRQKTGCGFSPSGDINIYEREIQVYPIKVELAQCYDEFTQTVLAEKLKTGNMQADIQGTEIQQIVTTQLNHAIQKDLKAALFFGNRASGAGRLSVIDGLWSVHIPALVAASTTPKIAAGSGSALTAGDGKALLEGVYNNATDELKGLGSSMLQFHVSGTVYDQYRMDIQSAAFSSGFVETTVNGVSTLSYNGIQLVEHREWDAATAAHSHFVMLTTPKNIVLGTDLLSDLTSFKTWYDEKDEMVYTKLNGQFGANYIHGSLFSVAY